MSHRLGCELADRIAAIAPVAGVLGIAPDACQPSRPVPVFDVHGTGDIVVPYNGGTPLVPRLGFGLVFRSVQETMQVWRERNACSEVAEVTYERGDVTCETWSSCAEGADVQLCTVRRGGHTWPGAPLFGTSQNLETTEAIIDFFEDHPMPVAE